MELFQPRVEKAITNVQKHYLFLEQTKSNFVCTETLKVSNLKRNMNLVYLRMNLSHNLLIPIYKMQQMLIKGN